MLKKLRNLNFVLLMTVVLASFAVVGCDSDDDDDNSLMDAKIRVLHASPDAPAVDVLVDGNIVLSDVPYKAASGYLNLTAGQHNIKVNAAGTDTTVIEVDSMFESDKKYTVIASDYLSNISPLLVTDNTAAPGSGNVKVRVVHGNPAAAAVDVYVTAPDADLTGVEPTLTNVPFQAISDFLEIPAGDYQIRVTLTGNMNVIYDSGTLALGSGGELTIVAVKAIMGASPLNLLALTGDSESPVLELMNAPVLVRVLHASPDAPAVDVLVNDNIVLSDVPYKAASGYISLPAGTYNFKVNAAGTSATVIDVTTDLMKNTAYSVVAVDYLSDITALLIPEEYYTPGQGNFKLRVLHGSPSAPAVDVYITAPGANLMDVTPTLENVGFTDFSDNLEVPAGDYQIRITVAMTDTVVYDSGAVSLAAGANLTAVAVEAAMGVSPVSIVVLTGDSMNPTLEINNISTFLRAIHTSPDAPNVDVLVDDVVVLTDVPFKAASGYLELIPGNKNVKVNAAGTDTTVIDATVPLMYGSNYSVFAVGFLSGIEPLLVMDDFSVAPGDGMAKVRVLHASPDAPAVDIYVNGAMALADVPFKAISDYLEIGTGHTNFMVKAAGTDTTVINVTVEIMPGKFYTVAAVGALSSIEPLLVTDVE